MPFERPNMTKEVVFMLAVVVVETMFLLIQAVKSYTTKSTDDLSMPAFSIFFVTGLAWTAWGLYQKDLPLTISGGLQVVGSGSILVAIYLYGT